MEAEAAVYRRFVTDRFKLKPLQVAEIAASHYGFYDLDLQDNDMGTYKLVASATGRTVTAKGKTLEEAVERLLEVFGS